MTYGSSTVKRRTSAELALVDDAIVAAVELNAPITLRGVYYRVVSAGAVEKTEDGYRLVGRQLLKLRRAGRVRYADITDGTRWITKPQSWNRLDQMLEDAAASYRRSVWHDQRVDVQIFTEKDAISGVVLPVTERWDVPLGVARGYASESFAWSCAQSMCATRGEVYVYQLGDHDPSGVDAWRDFTEKVRRFARRAVRRRRRAGCISSAWPSPSSRSRNGSCRPGRPSGPTRGRPGSAASPSRSTPSRPRCCAASSRTPSPSTSTLKRSA